ncbi:MAG: hypothetical protein DBY43_06405 [Clostridiaceae bacterium]|nr:MAG: hypothetical protein DBY43_06405 [Clostridiaceae bacterium]
MKVYKQKVRSKRELLTELGLVTWRTRQEVTSLLTIIAKRVSEIRFDNIIHSIITSDMTPEEIVRYLTFVEIPMKEVS